MKKNLSEIVADNYTDIPNLLDREHVALCRWGPDSDLTVARKTALQNPGIRSMLRNGGIIKGIFVWGPPRYTKEMSAHSCDYVSLTLEMEYQGRNVMALINETDRTVILPDDIPLPSANVSPVPTTTLLHSVVNTTSTQQNRDSCPAFLVNPPEFSCPREMQPLPETHAIADPDHPTQKEIDAIPVDFPGVDRMTLINAALSNPCVKEFLKSGGVIEGITDQSRPFLNQSETVRWPPTLMADRRVNCTDLLVFFDIDPSSGRVTRIRGETR